MANRPTGRRPISGTSRILRDTVAGPNRPDVNLGTTIPGRGRVFTPRQIDFIGNIFETKRAGQPVVRPDDLLALRVELRNLTVQPGTPPMLKKTGNAAAYLILHFPPQAITEETFFQEAPEGMGTADPDPTLTRLPDPDTGQPSETFPAYRTIRARIADESRLVFKVPGDAVIPYTLEGILTAVQGLEPKVAANARPRQIRIRIVATKLLFQPAVMKAMTPARRGAMASFAVSSLRIAQGDSGQSTLMRRQLSAGAGFTDVTKLRPAARFPGIVARPPRPKAPNATTTAIEIPWRLILSPHKNTRWRHAH